MEIAVYADSKGSGTCRSCGARITWAETTRGKRMPFDELLVLKTQGDLLGGERVVEIVDGDRNHFASCPDGEKWSRK